MSFEVYVPSHSTTQDKGMNLKNVLSYQGYVTKPGLPKARNRADTKLYKVSVWHYTILSTLEPQHSKVAGSKLREGIAECGKNDGVEKMSLTLPWMDRHMHRDWQIRLRT